MMMLRAVSALLLVVGLGCHSAPAGSKKLIHRVERFGVYYVLPLPLGSKFREYWFYTAKDGSQVRHGAYRTFSQNEVLVYEAHYRDGVREGAETIWDDSGLKMYEDEYRNGEKISSARFAGGRLVYKDAIVEEPDLGKIHKIYSDGRWYYVTECSGEGTLVSDLAPNRCN